MLAELLGLLVGHAAATALWRLLLVSVLALGGLKHKSKVVKKSCNPAWGESFEFKGVLRELIAEPGLQLECWDWDMGPQRDDRLGAIPLAR